MPSIFIVPQITNTIEMILLVFDFNNNLREVSVQWMEQVLHRRIDIRHKIQVLLQPISENCTFNQLNYSAFLVDCDGVIVQERVVNSDSCRDGLCNTKFFPFTAEKNEYFRVSLVVSNGVGQSSVMTFDDIIGEPVRLMHIL